MSGKPAARVGDKIMCLVPQTTPAALPHAPTPGLPILPPGCPTVLIGGAPAARVTDKSMCPTPAPAPNPILKGAFPVAIGGLPAARITDSAAHPGSVVLPPGCPTVLIGLAGVAGNVDAGREMAEAAATGRTSGSTQQSYQNCGVESSRQIINKSTHGNITEDALLDSAMNSGFAEEVLTSGGSLHREESGATNASDRQNILAADGVGSSIQEFTAQNLGMAMTKGSAVVAALDAGILWGDPSSRGGGHAVTVVGVEYDSKGDPTSVFINDTGTGTSAQKVPAKQFLKAGNDYKYSSFNVTDDPIF